MESNKTKIKVCGLKHPLEVKCAADYGANWYGMIFEKDSPRFISYKQAEVMLNSTPDCIEPIAVTVNPAKSKVQDKSEISKNAPSPSFAFAPFNTCWSEASSILMPRPFTPFCESGMRLVPWSIPAYNGTENETSLFTRRLEDDSRPFITATTLFSEMRSCSE